jgi:hypothetical protein
MPYLLLVIGLLIGLFALYRFFIQADIHQVKAAFLTAGFIVFCLSLLYLSVTGRLPAALVMLVTIAPIALEFYKKKTPPPPQTDSSVSSTKEALDILGLKEGATKSQIEKSYKKLMQKVHPDLEGSDWMAAKLNQARDILLKSDR